MAATRHRFGSLRWRLLAAFLTVAVGAVALLALVAVISVDQRTATLAEGQRTRLRSQVADALAAAYTAGRGSWTPADLAGVRALAGAHEMGVVIIDHAGKDVTGYGPGHDGWDLPAHPGADATHEGSDAHHDSTRPTPTGPTGRVTPEPTGDVHDESPGAEHSGSVHGLPVPDLVTMQPAGLAIEPAAPTAAAGSATLTAEGTETVTVPIVVGGKQVGSARLTLPTAPDPTVAAAREALLRNVGLGAALAIALAAVAAGFVARRMSRPVAALTAATRAFAAGDPHASQLVRPGPGELGELGAAFTSMAATVRRQDDLRRSVVADVAHELRTPVTVLRGQTEALLDGIASPTPHQLVSLHDEVLRLERLTDDLATLSAADAAGLSLHTEPTDLGALARRAIDSLATVFDDAGVALRVDVADEVVVAGDDTRLNQVVTNLLTNAAKFTPNGGMVTISVACDGPHATLTVADTGPGIPAEDLPHVFDRFWRGKSARGHRGTGIGLAVVEALVTAHGGTVTAESPHDGGARFTVQLKAIAPDAKGSRTRRIRGQGRLPPGAVWPRISEDGS